MPNPPKPVECQRKAGNPSKRPRPNPVSVVSPLDAVPLPLQDLETAGLGPSGLIRTGDVAAKQTSVPPSGAAIGAFDRYLPEWFAIFSL